MPLGLIDIPGNERALSSFFVSGKAIQQISRKIFCKKVFSNWIYYESIQTSRRPKTVENRMDRRSEHFKIVREFV